MIIDYWNPKKEDDNDGWNSMQLTKILIGLLSFAVFGTMILKIIIQNQVIIKLLIEINGKIR